MGYQLKDLLKLAKTVEIKFSRIIMGNGLYKMANQHLYNLQISKKRKKSKSPQTGIVSLLHYLYIYLSEFTNLLFAI